MKTIPREDIELEMVEFIPKELKQGVFYWSKRFDTACHLCLCGCGNLTVTPVAMGFKMIDEGGKITLLGSVGNFNFPCKSHYIITKGRANFI